MNTTATMSPEVIEGEPVSPPDKPTNTSLMEKLPALLRLVGAGALLIAMYSFLVKGWQEGDDMLRYLLMLGHTGVLTVIAVSCNHWLKENKSARLLLTLSLVSVAVNFAILGALIFSQAGVLTDYPAYVAWSAGNMTEALMTTAGSMLILIPTTFLGFAVLARSISRNLATLFLVSNVVLLIPLRDPHLVGLIALALGMLTMLFTQQTSRKHIAAKTHDGLIALAITFIPVGILIGRTLWLYNLDAFLLTIMTFTMYLLVRQVSMYMDKSSGVYGFLGFLSLIPAVMMIPLVGWSSHEFVDSFFSRGFVVWDSLRQLITPFAFATAAAMIYDIARRHQKQAGFYLWTASTLLVIGVVANQTMFDSFIPAVCAMVTGITVLVYGYQQKLRSLFSAGLIMTLSGIFQQFYELMHHFNLGSWITLAVIGIVTIVIASVLDAKGGQIKQRVTMWKTSFKDWQ